MGIHLAALTTSQVAEVLDLAKNKASKVDQKKIDDLLNTDTPVPELRAARDRHRPTSSSSEERIEALR